MSELLSRPIETTAQDDTTPQGPGEAREAASSWLDDFPAELRHNEDLRGFEKAEDAVRAYVDLKAAQPVKPDGPDGYEVTVPEGLPVDQGLMDAFRVTAHQAGLSRDQAKALTDWWNERAGASVKEAEQTRAGWRKELEDEWGGRFDVRVEAARQALRKLAPVEFVNYLDQTGLGDHPAMVRMFHRISQAIGEDSLIQGAPGAPLTTPRTAGGTPLLSFPSMEKG
ncbi:MAG: hypothetical protein V1742_03520 [Pseudomonadota bacterium]